MGRQRSPALGHVPSEGTHRTPGGQGHCVKMPWRRGTEEELAFLREDGIRPGEEVKFRLSGGQGERMDSTKRNREKEGGHSGSKARHGMAAQFKPRHVYVGSGGLRGEMGGKPAVWGVKSDVGVSYSSVALCSFPSVCTTLSYRTFTESL